MNIKDVRIKRSKRVKYFQIRVIDGEITALVPDFMSEAKIHQKLIELSDEIDKIFGNLELTKRPEILHEGYELHYLGKSYKIKFSTRVFEPRIDKDNILIDRKLATDWQEVFKKWYMKRAREYFYKTAVQYSALMGVRFTQLKLSSAKRKWGSCNSKGVIILVWRLIMAPPKAIDYVIVHELAHRKYMHHKSSFWDFVHQFMKDYEKGEEWLRLNGYKLHL